MPEPSFFLNSPVTPELDLADASSTLLQPSQTLSASSSLFRSISSIGRKRPRNDNNNEPLSSFDSQSSSSLASPGPPSLVNTDYRLAGGGAIQQTRLELELERQGTPTPTPAELDYRPNRYRDRLQPSVSPVDASCDSLASMDLERSVSGGNGNGNGNGNCRKRSRGNSDLSTFYSAEESVEKKRPAGGGGWGRAVLSVVGKVWDFCWSGAFRGFHAGGGRGYDMSPGTPPQLAEYDNSSSLFTDKGNIHMESTDKCQKSHDVPGQYPDDEIKDNWVVVTSGREQEQQPSTNATKRVHKQNPRRRPLTSRLGKRSTITFNRPSTPTPSMDNTTESSTTETSASETRLSSEAQRHAAKIRRIEREEDASLRRLNKQLQTMIREGKEALGTRIEVEEDTMDMEDF